MSNETTSKAGEEKPIDYWYPAESLRGKSVLRIPLSLVTNDPFNLDPFPPSDNE